MMYMPNKRFERDAPTAGFAACFRAPQAARWAPLLLITFGILEHE